MGSPAGRARRVVALIWIAFLVRGAFYAAVLPMWEGFDEYAHFAFVHHLKTFETLPRYNDLVSAEISRSLRLVPLPWSLNDWAPPAMSHDNYWRLSAEERSVREEGLKNLSADLQTIREGEIIDEAKQPPLYYILGAFVLRAFSGASLPARVFALRLFSVLIASLVLPLAFALARRILGEVQALLVTIFIASMPGFLIAISRVGNDCLAVVLFAVLAHALIRPEPWDAVGAVLIGITLAAGLLTKAYFVAAIPVVLLSAVVALFRAPSAARVQSLTRISAGLILTLVLSAWWYVRTLGLGGQVWIDAAPTSPMSLEQAWQFALKMDWWEAVKVILNGHIWVGGWSFLGVRSWMYIPFRWFFILGLPAGCFWLVRHRSQFWTIGGLYAGFWAALLYHAFLNFINVGVPASTGWYLYAVVACEGILLCSATQWLGTRLQGITIASITSLFLLLEAYATHFVLIPYYVGLVTHRADSSLTAFYVSQALQLGWHELLFRITVYTDFGVVTVVSLWVMFLFSSAYLVTVAWRYGRSRKQIL